MTVYSVSFDDGYRWEHPASNPQEAVGLAVEFWRQSHIPRGCRPSLCA